MEAKAWIAPEKDPVRPVPLGELTDRFVELLDLPAAEPEVQDIAATLHGALEAARQTDVVELLDDAVRFAHGRLVVRGLTDATCEQVGSALEAAAAPTLAGADREHVHTLFSRRSTEPARTPPDSATLGPKGAAYLERLLQGDRTGALALTRRWVADGMDIFEILLDILEPAQQEVGRLWAHGMISVAQEHFCTAVTQFVMTDLYPALFTGEDSQRRLVAVHVPGSSHHVGLRMVADVLECRDWSTTYVVDDVTVESLPGLVAADQADVLLISASMPSQIASVSAMIRAVRQDTRTRGVRVVVGGRPFLVAPHLVEVVGADGWAPDARTAVDVCNGLVGGDVEER